MGVFDNLDPVAGLDSSERTNAFGEPLPAGPGEVSKGLKRGALRLGAEVARGAEAVAKGTGFGAVKSRAGEIATDLNTQADELAPRVGSYKDINSIGTAADYATSLVAENAVQLPLTALAAFLGAKGGARILGNKALASMVGGAAGAFVPSYVQNFGDVYNEQREAGIDDPTTAAKYALPISALDSIGPGLLAGILLKPEKAAVKAGAKEFLDKIMKGIVGGVAEEAPTETLQEDLAIRAHAAVDPNFDPNSDENIQRRKEAAVGGAVVGGVVGGGGGVVHALVAPVDHAAVPAAPSEEPAAPAAPVQVPVAAPVQVPAETPFPTLNTPEEILPLINANTPDALEERFVADRRAAADAEFTANPEKVTAQFMNSAVAVAESRISALDAELALPAKERSRTKQAIVKERLTLIGQLEPMRKRASTLSVLADTPNYQEKSPLVEGTLLNVQQPEVPNATNQGIIQQGSIAEHRNGNARGQATETGDRNRNVSGGPIEETGQAIQTNEAGQQVSHRSDAKQVFAEQVARIRQEQGLLLSSDQAKLLRRAASAPAAPAPKLAVVTSHNRENLKFAPTDVRAESFMNESARVVEANVNELVANGMVKETSAQSVRNVINEGVRAGLETRDVEMAKSSIEAGVRKALKGKVAKVDIEPIIDKMMAGISAQTNRFVPFSSGGPLKSELRPTLAGLPDRAWQAPMFSDIPSSPNAITPPTGWAELNTLANEYNALAGLPPAVEIDYLLVDSDLGKRTSDAYEQMKVLSTDPVVLSAYRTFADETLAQFDFLIAKGYTFTKIHTEPYGGFTGKTVEEQNAVHAHMRKDVLENKNIDINDEGVSHPFLTDEENWKFRAVHDMFGHMKSGYDFGNRGEYNIFRVQAQMYSAIARGPLATEVAGQNMWIWYGGKNEGIVGVAVREYPQQKADMLPQALIQELLGDITGRKAAAPSPTTAIQFDHYGNVPTGVTDPNKIGSGVLGRDQTIARNNGLVYTSAIVHGADYREPEVQGKTKYTGTLDASKVHLASEGNPLFQQAKAEITAQGIFNDSMVWMEYAKKVRDAGFDAIMYAGGQLRIFTPQRVSRAFDLSKAQAKSPDILAHHLDKTGGTWNLITGVEMGGTPFYTVSPYKHREAVIPGQPTAEQISAYIAANEDMLSNPVHSLGTWFDREVGVTNLDVVVITPSYTEAQRIARKAKQKAFFNLRTYEEIFTDQPEPVQPELFRNVQGFVNLDAAQRYKGQQAIDYLEHILGTPTRLEVRPFVQADPSGHTGMFRGGHLKDVIEMALNSKEVLSVAAHEGFHFVETRYLSGEERVVLSRAFGKESRLFKQLTAATRRYDQENGTDISREIEMIPAEAHAYGFEFWKRGDLYADGALASVFRKIAELFAKIKNYIDGFGFTSAEDIFRAIDRGQYARRENQALRIETSEGGSWFDDIEPDAIPGLARVGEKTSGPASAAKGRPYWIKDGHDVAKMRRRIKSLALEGETARDWHRKSGEMMLSLYKGDIRQAEILAKLVAVFSPRTPVGGDMKFALQAINQFRMNEPIRAGVFPTAMSKKALQILTGTEDEKLVTGIKRNTFYRNLMSAIDPVNFNSETQGATIDMWMSHAFGFNHNVTGRVTTSEYRYAEAEVGRLARELGWTIEETQAAIWVSTKARFNQVRADARKWGLDRGLFVAGKGNENQSEMFATPGGNVKKLAKGQETHRKYLENWTKLALSVPLDQRQYDAANYNYNDAIVELVANGKLREHTIEAGSAYLSELGVDASGNIDTDVMPGELALKFYSRAALADLITEAKRGEAQLTQMHSVLGKIIDHAEIPEDMQRAVLGNTIKGYAHGTTSSFKTFYDENISSGMALSRKSAGYKNVFDVLTSYNQRKDRLIVDSVDGKLSEWRNGANTANFENATRALLERTVNAYALDSAEMQTIISKLGQKERAMFKQATDMIADRLSAEFAADKRSFASLLGQDSKQYAEWEGNRAIQVAQLINDGYFPERRYGDHGVHTYIEVGGKRLTLNYELHEHRGEAERRIAALNAVLKDFPDIKTEYAFKYKAEYDGSVSFQQFLDMARRNGIELTQVERERLAKSMIASDSVRRNRVFRRKNIPGFSEDGERILAEFGVTMANKIAYSEFGAAMQDSLKGTVVQTKFGVDGQPEINTYEGTNAWREDGELAGFYRNLADHTTDFVTSPNPGNKISSTLRAAATLQFLGGSLSAGAVQLSSLAMNTAPYLSAYTGYTNALGKTFAALKVAATNHKALTDINTLQDLSHAIPDVDGVPGLRQALTVAVQDGTTLDTEIYQIMGLTRARTLSMSRGVRKAAEVWMAPFRITEQWNRISTFIAAYKVGQENNLTGDRLYKFAQQAVALTQGRYDEANRPALARGPVGALLFTFKAYPLFMLETMTHLAKENPKAAVIMLLSLTAVAGVEGMPFAEDIEDIIDTIAQRVFGSSFNSKRAMRNMFKSASETITGVDLSGVLMHGLANQLTGLNFASRVGMGNLLPGTRIGTADADYKKVMSEVLGPAGSVATGWLNGIDALNRGEFVEAMKAAGPLAVQNMIKGVQSFQDGYASDLGGRKIVPASSWESFWQTLGFSSSALSSAYEVDRIDKAQAAFYKQAQTDVTSDIIKGIRDGNAERVKDAVEFIGAWNRSNPEMPLAISGSSLRRTIALNGLPLNQRNLLLLPRALRGGSESMAQLYGAER